MEGERPGGFGDFQGVREVLDPSRSELSIAEVNRLERAGEIALAMELNARLIGYLGASDQSIARIYQANERRLITKLGRRGHWLLSGQKLLGTETPKNEIPAKAINALPKVTVVVPCFNAERYLPATIESIKAQTYSNFECILVDDFSSDATSAIAKQVAQADKRFRFYQHRANGGLAASRNSGIRLARGEYVTFLDADDLLAPMSLTNRAHALAAHHSDEMVAGTYDYSITVDNDFNGLIEAVPVNGRPEYADFISTKGDCPFNANQPMLKRSVLLEMGGFPEEYPQAEDWRLWSKVMRAGFMFLAVPFVGSGYRQTPGSMIRRNPLLHVKRSKGNFFRSYSPVASEVDPVEVAYEERFFGGPLFIEPWGYYFAQQEFIKRAIGFIGIELGRLRDQGRDPDMAALREFMFSQCPDFLSCVTGYTSKNLFGWLENGYKRYFGVESIGEDQQLRFRSVATEFLGCLFQEGGGVKVGKSSRMAPIRPKNVRPPVVVDVLFFPHKKYHTRSFELMIPALKAAGLSFRFVDISVPYRDEAAYDPGLAHWFMSYNEFVFSRVRAKCVVCMNDWDTVVKPLVKSANKCGIPTVGIVEGVQDFHDADTGRLRRPYREVSNVFLPGQFDKKYFDDVGQELWVTGVQRLDGLDDYRLRRLAAEKPVRPLVVVNVNFSYGVMVDSRAQWLSDIKAACDRNGFDMVVSQHPQDDGDLSEYVVSTESLYDLLTRSAVFISRFSGAILESLVIGCPVVYYNGHGEQVDKFHDSLGDYRVANDPESLASQLASAVKDHVRSGPFLQAHCDIGAQTPGSSVEKTVAALKDLLLKYDFDQSKAADFKVMLGGI